MEIENQKYENKFGKLVAAITSNNSKEVNKMINQVPYSMISDYVFKLQRYKYDRFPLTKYTIKKLMEKKNPPALKS